MKKFDMKLRVISSVVLTVLILAGSALGATVGFTPDNAVFAETDLQIVQVYVDDVANMLGASMVVEFDPAVVTPVAVTLGEFMTGGSCPPFFFWVNETTFVNTLELDAAMLGCVLDGGGVLFNITFAGVDSGTSPLTLTSSILRDSENITIPSTTLAGSVTYVAEITANLAFETQGVPFVDDGTAEICLLVEDVEDFLLMSVEFSFDPSVIVPLAVYPGQALLDAGCPFFLDWINNDDFVDTMEIDAALLGCSTAMTGPVVCVTFEGVDLGDSPLLWQQVVVRDGANRQVMINAVDGLIMFDPVIGTTSLSLGALKCIYR